MKHISEVCREAIDLLRREQAIKDRIDSLGNYEIERLLRIEAAARDMVIARGKAWTGAAPWYEFGLAEERLAQLLHKQAPLDLEPAALARVLHGEADAAE